MIRNPELIAALAKTELCATYYALCDSFPMREQKASLPAPQIKTLAAGRLAIEKLAGPGRTYRLLSPPEGLSLHFRISSHGTVEADVEWLEAGEGCTFAILCNLVHRAQSGAAPQPPYPRPLALSPGELIAIMEEFSGLSYQLAGWLRA